MEVEIVDSRKQKTVTVLKNVSSSTTIETVKREIHKSNKAMYPDRVQIRLEPKGKGQNTKDTLESLGIKNGSKLYLKDLGPQIGWTTVFLTEYAGPLAIYALFYIRPWIIYGRGAADKPYAPVVHIAAACWIGHYAKRLLETLFVHRFSHGTMPIMNIVKNSTYYWGFAAFVAYYANHPLYTPPLLGNLQVYGGLAAFLFCEFGNLSIHVALRNLRPPGTKERKIPFPTQNPFTLLFNLVSCPNYTYEVGSWAAFSVMTQCVPAALFTATGFYQMAVWALGKHRNYKKEFPKYPKSRKAIVPFFL